MGQQHDFSFGSKAFNEFHHGRNKDAKKPRARKKKTTAEVKRLQSAADQEMANHYEKQAKTRASRFARILGGKDSAQAVKIAKSDLQPFAFQDVDMFREAGWEVVAAPSIAARRTIRNPAPLGDDGLARALIVLGPVNADLLDQLERNGLDVYPAPKAYRLGLKKNPEKSIKKKVYQKILNTTQAGQAWNALELSNALQMPLGQVEQALQQLASEGLAHSPKADLFGPVWVAGAHQRGLFENPSKGAKAVKKARAWFGKESLVSDPKPIKIADSLEFVEVGDILAIEYLSNKFDGRNRAYRHDVTGTRKLHISTDGTVLIIKPGFKITKRGIEG